MKNCIIVFLLIASIHTAYADDSAATLKNESEAGVVVTGGNTQTDTISLKEKTAYEWNKNIVKFGANFLTTSNAGNQQAYQWGLGLRYERELSDQIGIFLGQAVESNKYQGILQRYNSDLGGRYTFVKTEQFKWASELGYRFTRENYTLDGFKNINFLRLYNELERMFTKTFTIKWWIEFLPNINTSEAYKLNTELSGSDAIS